MAEEKLSKYYFHALKKIRHQEILFITEEMKEQCEYLKSKGYIDILEIMILDEYDEKEKSISTKSSKMIAQITPEGKNYADIHTSWVKKIRWEFVISAVAVLISVLTLILDAYLEMVVK